MKFTRADQVVRSKLCMGCGACMAVCLHDAIRLIDYDEFGLRPAIDESKCAKCGMCVKVCPGIYLKTPDFDKISSDQFSQEWGNVLEIWEGYAADNEIRFNGASGGIVTALSLYTIEKNKSDAVLHICADPKNPLSNTVVLSRSRNELMRGTGSRYSPAAVCSYISKITKDDGKFTFVGKPCDTAGLFKISKIKQYIKSQIRLSISIFCAGSPTTKGTYALLNKMGVSPCDVEQIRYRGFGWPGLTTVNTTDGRSKQINYEQAWGGILSDYGQFRCSICSDSTGEFSDIACGDGWHRKDKDNLGWSLIVIKSENGRSILKEAIESGYIRANQLERNLLNLAQASILRRKRLLFGRLQLMRLFGMPVPDFSGFYLRENWRRVDGLSKIKAYYVTLKELIKSRIVRLKNL